MVADQRRGALRTGLIAAAAICGALGGAAGAAEQEYVIWRTSSLGGFEWQPASGTYASKQECEDAVEGRKRRIARAVDFLKRIGVDDTLQRAVGDRIYECRPALTGPRPDPDRGGRGQSP